MSAAGAPLVVAAAADGAYALPLAVMLRSAAARPGCAVSPDDLLARDGRARPL